MCLTIGREGGIQGDGERRREGETEGGRKGGGMDEGRKGGTSRRATRKLKPNTVADDLFLSRCGPLCRATVWRSRPASRTRSCCRPSASTPRWPRSSRRSPSPRAAGHRRRRLVAEAKPLRCHPTQPAVRLWRGASEGGRRRGGRGVGHRLRQTLPASGGLGGLFQCSGRWRKLSGGEHR